MSTMRPKWKRSEVDSPPALRSGLRPRLVKDGKLKAPTSAPLRDPFDVLGDQEVALIISYLGARDTETLRRVSKLWKASSEYHCGKSSLLQHFPFMSLRARKAKSQEDANLLFRRCLYHHESLKIGLATRAFRFTGASTWDIRDDCVLWSSTEGPVSSRQLRYPGGPTLTDLRPKKLDLGKLFPNFPLIRYVQAISREEMVVTLGDCLCEIIPAGQTSIVNNTRLAKVGLDGTVKWSVDFRASTSRLAIGNDSLYLLHDTSVVGTQGNSRLSLRKLHEADGSLVMDVEISPTASFFLKYDTVENKSLILTKDEEFVLWHDNCGGWYILSATTGHNIQNFVHRNMITSTNESIPHSIRSSFWDFYSYNRRFLIYEEKSEKFFLNHHMLPGYPTICNLSLDGNRSLFFHAVHDVPMPTRKTERDWMMRVPVPLTMDQDTTMGVSSATAEMRQVYLEPSFHPSTPTEITLPSRSDGDGQRRSLTVKLPWKLRNNDYFGMLKDYLVFHNASDGVLFVVDFWPNW